MRIADSSFLVALFQSGDQNFATAEREASKSEPILIPSEVLGETLGLLQKRKGIDFARLVRQWLDTQPHVQYVFTQRSHFDVASRVFAKAPERINYVDAILVAWKLATGADLLSFDADLAKAAKREAG